MKGLLVGVGSFLLLRNSSPEEIAPKYHHLRPRRLRRTSAARNAACSGQHSLAGVDLHGAVCLPMSTPLIGADAHLREGTLLPEEITQNDHHLRLRRLRRGTSTQHATCSGQHSLIGVDVPAQILPSTRTLFIGGRSAQKDQCGRNWSFHGSILPVFVFDDEIVIVVDLVPLGLLVVQVFQGVVDPVGVVLSELL